MTLVDFFAAGAVALSGCALTAVDCGGHWLLGCGLMFVALVLAGLAGAEVERGA